MGTAAGALALYVLDNLPEWIDSGVKVYDLFTKTKAMIDENAAPGDEFWAGLAARAAELEARVNDTSKDA